MIYLISYKCVEYKYESSLNLSLYRTQRWNNYHKISKRNFLSYVLLVITREAPLRHPKRTDSIPI